MWNVPKDLNIGTVPKWASGHKSCLYLLRSCLPISDLECFLLQIRPGRLARPCPSNQLSDRLLFYLPGVRILVADSNLRRLVDILLLHTIVLEGSLDLQLLQ